MRRRGFERSCCPYGSMSLCPGIRRGCPTQCPQFLAKSLPLFVGGYFRSAFVCCQFSSIQRRPRQSGGRHADNPTEDGTEVWTEKRSDHSQRGETKFVSETFAPPSVTDTRTADESHRQPHSRSVIDGCTALSTSAIYATDGDSDANAASCSVVVSPRTRETLRDLAGSGGNDSGDDGGGGGGGGGDRWWNQRSSTSSMPAGDDLPEML